MRIFHVLAYEGFVASGQPKYSSPALSDLFGSVDRLHVSGYASQASGTTPALQVTEQISMDGENWVSGILYLGVSGQLLGAGETLFQGFDLDPDIPFFSGKSSFVRLAVTVTGTSSPSAMVRIWATGRDRARGARTMARAG